MNILTGEKCSIFFLFCRKIDDVFFCVNSAEEAGEVVTIKYTFQIIHHRLTWFEEGDQHLKLFLWTTVIHVLLILLCQCDNLFQKRFQKILIKYWWNKVVFYFIPRKYVKGFSNLKDTTGKWTIIRLLIIKKSWPV